MAVIEQGVLKWSGMLVIVTVLLINATTVACVFSLVSVPYRALRNVLVLLTLKPVVKLFFYFNGKKVLRGSASGRHCTLRGLLPWQRIRMSELWEYWLCFGICCWLAMEIDLEFQANKTELWLSVLKMIKWVIFHVVSLQYLLPQGLFTVD